MVTQDRNSLQQRVVTWDSASGQTRSPRSNPKDLVACHMTPHTPCGTSYLAFCDAALLQRSGRWIYGQVRIKDDAGVFPPCAEGSS
jgi:hypothetical protein